MKAIKHRLISRRGESLIETLAAMLIIVMGMTALAGAIVTAARLNHTASEYASFYDSINDTGNNVTVTVKYDVQEQTYSAKLMRNSSGRLYSYEIKP